MSKPNPNRIPTGSNAPLTHSPFGSLDSLDSLGQLPAAPTAPGSASPASLPGPSTPGEQRHGAPKPGRVVLRKETAHRGGKSVIVVDGFAPHLSADFIENLAKDLRKSCGCGGSVRERRIELQGDQPEKIRALLQAQGFRVAGV